MTTPELGTITPFIFELSSGGTGSYSWSHTRAAGAGLVVTFVYKSNGNPSATVSAVEYGGVAMTIRTQHVQGGVNRVGIVIATMEPGVGPTGSQTVAITLNLTNARDAAGYSGDVLDTAGCAGAGTSLASSDGGAAAQSVSYTPTDAGSLLVSLGGCTDASGTVDAGSGWTSQGTTQSRSTMQGVEIRLQARTAGGTSPLNAAIALSAAREHRAVACVEWLPAQAGNQNAAALMAA